MSLGVLHLSIHDTSYMVPLQQVLRVLRMAWFTGIPPAPGAPHVVGVLNISGVLHPVVSARKQLGFPDVTPLPEQRLLLLRGKPDFLLWVDDIYGFLEVPMTDFKPIRYTPQSPVEAVIRTQQGSTSVLRPEFFQPPALWEGI
ncbi:chemotaxis protein CheW [Deinococcus cellulosilyticus]|uniref:CheW-like domain-containing protein n=1 Tax=Deinococcus cellulosilyticus (strain DSM 18568 / NBRC 106333 / KACC 11606 / 5516J-15) TaxID=1223518 RepID=A0A511MUV4_DEIC1|nr:chemotaxis protein CheW [Deinococcus cellulosilyticus]GEM44380.1 hypothetical protein DC3_00150 [Deinococcus cellulosilyticus NBRC 106333 = KACC 11606]